MNKVLRYFLMTAMCACFSAATVNCAEAASVALFPLINNVEGGDELAGQVYEKSAVTALNAKKGFVMVENDTLTSSIEANSVKGQLPTQAQLAKIAKDGNVDFVIAVELNECEDIAMPSGEENRLKMNIKGNAVCYNALTGNFVKYRIYDDEDIPEVLSSRWDLLHERWGRQVRLAINHVLDAKK